MAGQLKSDIEQGKRVRRLLLNEVERLFTTDPHRLSEPELSRKNELLLRMAPNTLPRLNEHTGEDGGPILIKQITGMEIKTDGDSETTIQDTQSETNTGG